MATFTDARCALQPQVYVVSDPNACTGPVRFRTLREAVESAADALDRFLDEVDIWTPGDVLCVTLTHDEVFVCEPDGQIAQGEQADTLRRHVGAFMGEVVA